MTALTILETELLDGTQRGLPVNAKGASIRADFIRQILLSRVEGAAVLADPHGLRIRNAIIEGTLDLELVSTAIALEFRSCSFAHQVNLTGAALPRIVLSGSRIVVASAPALLADGLEVQGNFVLDDHFHAEAVGEPGTVRLRNAHIGGRLSFRGAELVNRSGPALICDYATVSGDLIFDGCTAFGNGNAGSVRLVGVNVSGQSSARHLTVTNKSGPAIHADRLSVDGDLVLDEDFDVSASSPDGSIRLVGSRIGGQVIFGTGAVRNDSGAGVFADRMTVDSGLEMCRELAVSGSGPDGAIRLVSASIGSQLLMRKSSIENSSGPALIADRMSVAGSLLMDSGFRATGSGDEGCIRFVSAHILGQLLVGPADLVNGTGPALSADDLEVSGDIFFRANFAGIGSGIGGAVRLPGAHIGGQVVAEESEFRNDAGPALFAEAVRVDGDLLLQPSLTMAGHGSRGTLLLSGAQVGGRMSMRGVRLDHSGERPSPSVLLDDAALGALWVDPEIWLTSRSFIRLDGMSYRGMPALGTAEAWIRVLRQCTEGYAAQPYQQLADAYVSGGRELDARQVLIAQQDDRRDRGLAADGAWGKVFRVFHRLGLSIQKATIGYGHRIWPAFVITVLLAAGSAATGWAAGHTHVDAKHDFALYRLVSPTSNARVACSTVEQLVYGIRAPFLADPDHGNCSLDTADTTGELYDCLFWVITSLTWASATLAVAGYTGLVRRT